MSQACQPFVIFLVARDTGKTFKLSCFYNHLLPEEHLAFTNNPIIRIAAKFQLYKFLLLRTLAVIYRHYLVASWSRGCPLERVVLFYKDLKPGGCSWCEHFPTPHLRNWCWKPFNYYSYYHCCCCCCRRWWYLLLCLLVLRTSISSLLQKVRQLIFLQSAMVCCRKVRQKIVTLTSMEEHITPVLNSLHWLPVEQRIIFKLLFIIHTQSA